MQIQKNVLELIGKTPMIQLDRCLPKIKHSIFGKAEFLNPGGSVKDRIALRIIESAEKRGELVAGGTIIEATSGNTGLGLCMVAAIKGYKSIIVMPDKMSKEKIDTLKAYGAKVILTPSGIEATDPRSHYSVAQKLSQETPNSYYANQFHNEDNLQTHYDTTGPEIWEQMGGKIDCLVNGAGTGGTISGVGKFLKEKNPDIKIILADPIGSILHDLYKYNEVKTPPAPYLIEGIGEDMLPGNMKFKYVDDVIQFNDKEAMQMCRNIVRTEGLFVGPSSAATVVCALKWAEKQSEPKRIVTFLCDNGDRYLSKVFNDDWMNTNRLL